jgi:cytolysin-activating lysine-acyltransferase
VDRRTEQLGLVAALMCGSSTYRALPMSYLSQWIAPALAHRFVWFAFAERGRPLAYWTWAFLAPDVEDRLIREPNARLHESEWNEGSNLWIMDFVAPYGYVMDVVRYLQRSFFSQYRVARSIRRRTDGSLRSESIWYGASGRAAPPESGGAFKYHLPPTAFAASQTEWIEAEQARTGEPAA